MAIAVEPFSFAVAELSDKYMSEFQRSGVVPKYIKTLSDRTGVQVIKGYNSIGLKGSWLSISKAHSFLLEFFTTYRTADQTDEANTDRTGTPVSPGHVSSEQNSPSDDSVSKKKFPRAVSKAPVNGKCRPFGETLNHTDSFGNPDCEDQAESLIVSRTDFQEIGIGQSDHSLDSLQEPGHISSDIGQGPESSNDGLETDKSIHSVPSTVRPKVNMQDKIQRTPVQVHERKTKRGRPQRNKSKQIARVNSSRPYQTSCKKNKHSRKIMVQKDKVVIPQDSKPAKRKSRGRSKKIEEDNKFPCTECDYKTVSKAKLSDHIQRMHKGSASSCDVCGKVFPNQTYMQRHRTSHVAPQHCCDVCGKMFKIEKAMRNHRKTHEDGYTRPVFHCDMCPKTFCSQYLVDCHVKSTHMGQKKSYLCSSCGKKFTTKHSLQEHSNAHSGIKPHVCEICGKGFSYDSALRDHKFTHEEVKQFQCTLCFKSFCQRSGLKMHMRIHKDTKQFQCEDCGREFTQKQALQRHERVHKGVKPFICRLCSRSFTDASIIRRHLILVHKIHKDAKTWREDIICNVKPDLDYHVGLAGEKASPSQEQNVVHSKTKHSANRRDSLKAGNETDKLNKKKPVAVGTVPPLLSEILFSQTSTSSTVSSGYDRDRSVDSNAQLVHASALRQTSGHVTSHPPDHHSSELLPQTHVPEPVKLKSVTATPSNSQPFSVLPHFMSGSSESIPPGCRDVNSRCTLEDQRPSIPHLAQGVIETPGHAPLQSDTPSNPVFLDGSQICKRDVPINYHRSPTADTHHCFDGHVQGSGEQETSAIITTAESTSSGTGKAAASTSVATPQPWSSFYYYSQLASQFGVNFAEYPYIASGALPGGGLGVGGGVGPSSHGMEHPPTVHPRPQPLSYSHGHSGTESLPHTQELHPNPSAMYHETHTGSSGHIVSPSPPCVAMSRGGHQGTHASVTARDSSSSPPVQKEIGGGVSHSPP